jgi:hypothetical protein
LLKSLIGAVALCGFLAAAARAQAPASTAPTTLPSELESFDREGFLQRDNDARLDLVVKALQWREQQLQNIRYVVKESYRNLDRDTGKVLSEASWPPRTMQRLGGSYRVDIAPAGQSADSWQGSFRWDGASMRQLYVDNDGSAPRGQISNNDDGGSASRTFDHMIGCRSWARKTTVARASTAVKSRRRFRMLSKGGARVIFQLRRNPILIAGER